MNRVFDRLPEFDEASRAFPIRAILGEPRPLRTKSWACPTWLDQGQEGACVGFSLAHELAAAPKIVKGVTEDTARSIYHLAQTLDEWEGEAYDGTSVLGGIKAVQQIHPNLITEYRWAFGLQDVLDTLSNFGPVVLGVNWYEGMFNTDSSGRIHVTGNLAGGHAILAKGLAVQRRTVRLHNSWGKDWGYRGSANISWDDLDRLLHEQGEALVPVTRNRI